MHSCPDQGHDWHEADGSVYQRHNGRPRGNVAVTCCWCGTTNSLPMYAACGKGTLLDVEHGPLKP